MKKSYMVFLGVLVIGITTVGIMVALLPTLQPTPEPITGLFWLFELDDTYEYEIEVFGSANWILYWDTENISSLNNTIIRVTVENLPSLHNLTTQEDFTTQIIQSVKISGAFTNDSELTVWASSNIIQMISACMLPNGSWSSIDTLYPDDFPEGYNPDSQYYVIILYEDYLHVKYQWTGSIDDGGGWSGNVSLETGVATEINYHYYHGGDISSSINLALVS